MAVSKFTGNKIVRTIKIPSRSSRGSSSSRRRSSGGSSISDRQKRRKELEREGLSPIEASRKETQEFSDSISKPSINTGGKVAQRAKEEGGFRLAGQGAESAGGRKVIAPTINTGGKVTQKGTSQQIILNEQQRRVYQGLSDQEKSNYIKQLRQRNQLNEAQRQQAREIRAKEGEEARKRYIDQVLNRRVQPIQSGELSEPELEAIKAKQERGTTLAVQSDKRLSKGERDAIRAIEDAIKPREIAQQVIIEKQSNKVKKTALERWADAINARQNAMLKRQTERQAKIDANKLARGQFVDTLPSAIRLQAKAFNSLINLSTFVFKTGVDFTVGFGKQIGNVGDKSLFLPVALGANIQQDISAGTARNSANFFKQLASKEQLDGLKQIYTDPKTYLFALAGLGFGALGAVLKKSKGKVTQTNTKPKPTKANENKIFQTKKGEYYVVAKGKTIKVPESMRNKFFKAQKKQVKKSEKATKKEEKAKKKAEAKAEKAKQKDIKKEITEFKKDFKLNKGDVELITKELSKAPKSKWTSKKRLITSKLLNTNRVKFNKKKFTIKIDSKGKISLEKKKKTPSIKEKAKKKAEEIIEKAKSQLSKEITKKKKQYTPAQTKATLRRLNRVFNRIRSNKAKAEAKAQFANLLQGKRVTIKSAEARNLLNQLVSKRQREKLKRITKPTDVQSKRVRKAKRKEIKKRISPKKEVSKKTKELSEAQKVAKELNKALKKQLSAEQKGTPLPKGIAKPKPKKSILQKIKRKAKGIINKSKNRVKELKAVLKRKKIESSVRKRVNKALKAEAKLQRELNKVSKKIVIPITRTTRVVSTVGVVRAKPRTKGIIKRTIQKASPKSIADRKAQALGFKNAKEQRTSLDQFKKATEPLEGKKLFGKSSKDKNRLNKKQLKEERKILKEALDDVRAGRKIIQQDFIRNNKKPMSLQEAKQLSRRIDRVFNRIRSSKAKAEAKKGFENLIQGKRVTIKSAEARNLLNQLVSKNIRNNIRKQKRADLQTSGARKAKRKDIRQSEAQRQAQLKKDVASGKFDVEVTESGAIILRPKVKPQRIKFFKDVVKKPKVKKGESITTKADGTVQILKTKTIKKTIPKQKLANAKVKQKTISKVKVKLAKPRARLKSKVRKAKKLSVIKVAVSEAKQQLAQEFKSLSKTLQATKVAQKLVQREAQAIDEISDSATKSISGTKSATRSATISKSAVAQKPKARTITKRSKKRVPPPEKIKLPKVKLSWDKKPPKGFEYLVNPVVRVKGRNRELKLRTTKNRALKKIVGAVDNSLSRSFKLKIVGLTRKKDIKSPPSFKKFRAKRSKGTAVLPVVEKSKFALDSKGEKQRISLAKELKRRKLIKRA